MTSERQNRLTAFNSMFETMDKADKDIACPHVIFYDRMRLAYHEANSEESSVSEEEKAIAMEEAKTAEALITILADKWLCFDKSNPSVIHHGNSDEPKSANYNECFMKTKRKFCWEHFRKIFALYLIEHG